MGCRLSIIVPVYNVEKYVGQCLSSIFSKRNESYPFEVIIVNDGTKDNSLQIIKPYIEKFNNCFLIDQKNQGLSVARNNGFAKANGDYVWFVDSDDWLEDNAIENVLKILDSFDCDIVAMPLHWRYPDKGKDRLDINIDNDKIVRGIDYINNYPRGAIQRNIISRSFILNNNLSFYPGILHEDGLYGTKLYYLANRVLISQKSYYNYRQTPNSIMHSLSMRSAESEMIVHKELMKFLSENETGYSEQLRIKLTGILIDALSFTWHLRNSDEYKKFLEDTRSYRIDQCMLCFQKASIRDKIVLLLKAYCPLFFIRLCRLYIYMR